MLDTSETQIAEKAKQPVCNFCKRTADPQISFITRNVFTCWQHWHTALAVALERHGGTPAAIRRFAEMEVRP